MIFCGSQTSLVTGVPMAQLLFAAPDAGIIVVPIMIYHQLKPLVGAWLARRYTAIEHPPAAVGPGVAKPGREIERVPIGHARRA